MELLTLRLGHTPLINPLNLNLLDNKDPFEGNIQPLNLKIKDIDGGSQRPTWASRGAAKATEQRQRIIVFIAGGATYSESRSCYEVSKKWNRDVVLGSTDMITPSTFIRELSRTRESRQSLNLAMDKTRSIPQQQQPQQPYPTQGGVPPGAQTGLPSRPSAGRMGPPQGIPSQMRPGSGHGSRNGLGGPRPMGGGGGPRSPPPHVAHGPGHAVTPVNSHGSYHRPTSSGGTKDGEKKEKEKKKKKLGLF
jgi:syntaxin-binding protein 1